MWQNYMVWDSFLEEPRELSESDSARMLYLKDDMTNKISYVQSLSNKPFDKHKHNSKARKVSLEWVHRLQKVDQP